MQELYKICLISLGCEKNTCDSEKMLHLLADRGYAITDDPEEAKAAIVNTCCFIQSATEESLDTIFELSQLKQNGLEFLICAGCMAERYQGQIEKEIPEVDAFLGTAALSGVADVLDLLRQEKETAKAGEKESISLYRDKNTLTSDLAGISRVMSQKPYTAYLKIADGCDKRCTYCSIPLFKGSFHSVPMEDLLREARELTDMGARELVLVAQETSGYGKDLCGEKQLHILLRKLSEIEELKWIRIMYCYPEELYPELIREMAENPKVLHYLDLPLQHTETGILKRMGRRITKEDLYRIVGELRENMPDMTIRTTMISGFPGETEVDHRALLETIKDLRFDHLGVFAYSQEEGTAAAGFPDQIADEVKETRRDEIMLLQQEIALENKKRFIGKTEEILVEGYLPDEDVYVGRTKHDAPDVDGMVFLSAGRELMSGTFVQGRITEASHYDLYAELLEDKDESAE